MPVFSDGQKISAALAWDRMIQSVPASYMVWKDGSTYRAECLLKGGTDYSGTGAATVIQEAIDASPAGALIILKAAKYELTSGLNITTRGITLSGESAFMHSEGLYGTTLYSTSSITFLTIKDTYDVTLKNFGIIGNNRGAKQTGLLIDNVQRLRIENVYIGYIDGYGLKTQNTFWDSSADNLWVNKCGDEENEYHAVYFGSDSADFHAFHFRSTAYYYRNVYVGGNDHYFIASQFHGETSRDKLPNVELADGGQHKIANSMFSWGEPHLTINSNANVITGNTFQNNDDLALSITGNLNKNHVINNRLSGDVSISGNDNIVKLNSHYVTENGGTATISNGNTSIVVSHGCDYTPSAEDIDVHPIESLGSASFWWVDTITSTQFTIHVNADPGQDVDFKWSVRRI